MQTYFETQQDLAALLEQASLLGEVRIRRGDGQTFVLRSEQTKQSPLDVKSVDLGVTTDEVVGFIREGRKVF